jgi:hypothetical protein
MKTRRPRSARARFRCRQAAAQPACSSWLPREGRRPGWHYVAVAGVEWGWPRSTPVEPEEQRWLQEACTLSVLASLEIHGEDRDAQMIDVGVIARAAEQLWSTTPGSPSWILLDVDALMSRLDRETPQGREDFVMTLLTFVHWMYLRKLLSAAERATLMARVDPHVPASFRKMGYRTPSVPAALRPS